METAWVTAALVLWRTTIKATMEAVTTVVAIATSITTVAMVLAGTLGLMITKVLTVKIMVRRRRVQIILPRALLISTLRYLKVTNSLYEDLK